MSEFDKKIYNTITKALKENRKVELKNTYEKNHYNISNGYNMRYINYTNTIKERLSLTKYNLMIVPFEDIEKNLEG